MAGKKYGDLNASTGGGNSDQYAVNQDKGGGVFETRKMTGAQLFSWIRGKLGTAARKDHGTGAGDVPLNSDLSSAAFVDHGTGAGDVPLNSDLSSAAYVDHGTGAGDVPLNSDLQPKTTGSATFTKSSNNIKLTNIVPDLSLEKGDVIEVSGTTKNDNLYTVESITDNNNIVVNYEHRNGAGSLSLTDETVSCTIKRVVKWYGAPLGLGQAWVAFTSGSYRVAGAVYTGLENRSMLASMLQNSLSSSKFGGLYVDGVYIFGSSGTEAFAHEVHVPPGATYKVGAAPNLTNVMPWGELR